MHDFVRAAVALAPPHLSVDVAINRARQVTAVFAGPLPAAHDAACAHVQSAAVRVVEAPFDLVVSTNGGYPLDRNLYQAVKGMAAAERIVRPGGTIVMAAACEDGVPADGAFARLLAEARTPADLVGRVRRARTGPLAGPGARARAGPGRGPALRRRPRRRRRRPSALSRRCPISTPRWRAALRAPRARGPGGRHARGPAHGGDRARRATADQSLRTSLAHPLCGCGTAAAKRPLTPRAPTGSGKSATAIVQLMSQVERRTHGREGGEGPPDRHGVRRRIAAGQRGGGDADRDALLLGLSPPRLPAERADTEERGARRARARRVLLHCGAPDLRAVVQADPRRARLGDGDHGAGPHSGPRVRHRPLPAAPHQRHSAADGVPDGRARDADPARLPRLPLAPPAGLGLPERAVPAH